MIVSSYLTEMVKYRIPKLRRDVDFCSWWGVSTPGHPLVNGGASSHDQAMRVTLSN